MTSSSESPEDFIVTWRAVHLNIIQENYTFWKELKNFFSWFHMWYFIKTGYMFFGILIKLASIKWMTCSSAGFFPYYYALLIDKL